MTDPRRTDEEEDELDRGTERGGMCLFTLSPINCYELLGKLRYVSILYITNSSFK